MSATLPLPFVLDGPNSAPVATNRGAVLSHLAENPEEFRADFSHWVAENWELWLTFARYADRMRRRREHYSADAVLHAIRFETDLADTTEHRWKVNNNLSADLARLYNRVTASDFFRLRERPSLPPTASALD